MLLQIWEATPTKGPLDDEYTVEARLSKEYTRKSWLPVMTLDFSVYLAPVSFQCKLLFVVFSSIMNPPGSDDSVTTKPAMSRDSAVMNVYGVNQGVKIHY